MSKEAKKEDEEAQKAAIEEVFDSPEGKKIIDDTVEHFRRETNAILGQLIRLHAMLEVSGELCPLCDRRLPHVEGCAVERAWNLPVEERREQAREWARSGASEQTDAPELDWPDVLRASEVEDRKVVS